MPLAEQKAIYKNLAKEVADFNGKVCIDDCFHINEELPVFSDSHAIQFQPMQCYEGSTITQIMYVLDIIMRAQKGDDDTMPFLMEKVLEFTTCSEENLKKYAEEMREYIEAHNIKKFSGLYGVANTGGHWILLGWDFKTRQISVIDSYYSIYSKELSRRDHAINKFF
jgi:hypothetical protein